MYASKDIRSNDFLHIEKLETLVFDPSTSCVAESVHQPGIRAYIKQRDEKATLYMITGNQVARRLYGALRFPEICRSRPQRQPTPGAAVGGGAVVGMEIIITSFCSGGTLPTLY